MSVESSAEMSVQVSGDGAPGELRSLAEWLSGEDMLQGRIRLAGAAPQDGMMGAAIEYLAVALGPGGISTAFAAVLIAWIRSRSSSISVALSRPDGATMRLEARNVRELPAGRIDELADRVSSMLATGAAVPGSRPGERTARGSGNPERPPRR
jgi:hypothetical protein